MKLPEYLSNKKDYLIVPKGEKKEIILNGNVHTNAYMRYYFEKGVHAKIEITYSEKYFSRSKEEIKRTDYVHGELRGITDTIILDGEKTIYEPFWFRTFRFIKIVIEAMEEDVIFYEPVMRKTGYPLEILTEIVTDSEKYNKLWEISIRTLQNCMAETYMDCPFYEQMQFSMDTRLQMLFTYAVSNDVKLAKKALKDFHYSMIPEGLIQGKYPSGYPQIISTFSLHYIFMLEEYYKQTADMETLRHYRSDVDVMLDYFDRHIGKSGLIENLDFWQFIDWQEAWSENMGVPEAVKYGPSTIINLMYAYALQSGAYIYEVTGRKELADEYRNRHKKITERVQELCWDEIQGMYREGPAFAQYSQHAQAWAIRNQMVSKIQAKRILEKALKKNDILKCSFSTCYELFRACEWAEYYEGTEELMKMWMQLLEMECTTCPEEPAHGRSECHAWSALPIYEMVRSIAGVCMEEEGWKKIRICPHMEYIKKISGKIVTPRGMIEFDFDAYADLYIVKLPDNLAGRLILPSRTVELEGGIIYEINDCR